MPNGQCIICLDTKHPTKCITAFDENSDWLEHYLICRCCIEHLNNACRFKAQCLAVSEETKELEFKALNKVFHDYNHQLDNDYEIENCDILSNDEEKYTDEKEEAKNHIECFICHDCGEKFVTKAELIKHITIGHNVSDDGCIESSNNRHCVRYKSKEHTCLKCGRGYVLETSLNEHLANCDGIRRHARSKADYQCECCKKYYTTKKILKAHKRRCELGFENRTTNFQCTNCNKYYISLKTLKDHCKRGCKKDNTNSIHVIFCKICDEYFSSILSLNQHIQLEHKTSNYYCDKCVINFETEEDYEVHKNTKHTSQNPINKKPRGRVASRRFTCEICGQEFGLLKAVIEHCITIHGMEEKVVRPYACDKCDNRFRSSTNLINHKLYHDRNRVNICSFCGKSFITKNDLTAHEYTHYNRRNYKCDKCEKAFKTNTNLRTHHLIVHTDPSLWKYVCHICNKRFPQKSNHDQHVRRHIGEKNFICPLCKKPFTSKSEMQEHVSYHSNFRAYKCEYCGKEYRKKHTYDVHLTKIHGVGNTKIPIREKKHACHICPSRFYDKLKLARHLCIHSGLKPFSCYACEKKFTDKSYLKHHLKIVHNMVHETKTEWFLIANKMSSSDQSCCVCLNNYLNLNQLSKPDENNVTLLTKLQTSIPQIEWRSSYRICDPCTNLLSIVHTFRETCIRSDIIRKQQLEAVQDSSEQKVEAEYVKYEDIKESFVENDFDNDANDDDDDVFEDKVDDSNYVEDVKDIKLKIKFSVSEDTSQPKRKRKVLRFQCEKCPNNYVSSTVLVKHCVQEHGMESKNVRPFACTRCKSRFGNSSNLLQHIKYHDAVRSNMCTYCGKGFITKTDLNIHEKQHLNMREYKCETCTKCFNTHKDLRSHKLVVHTDPQLWKYFCEYCNKKFPIKSNYDCHMRRHTGDKKFECHLCDKRFTDKCVLQRHMRTHSNVRDFKCSHCNKEYKDKRAWARSSFPSKERKYICHICPKAYYAKNKLTRHLYTHSGEKPFFCTICDKKFNDKSYVKQHMKKSHNVDTDADK
ncbi:hypothetical protein NQ318_021596 [Aromia moschata]|uniref:C2H2-type domain-containing protein n=1 Tax=Aromia moschata TaxID=1265417 RepID=A0AAV8YHB6_9CUCU|nr:hypothetical protein NQ318_021596 [Aromia moschata]